MADAIISTVAERVVAIITDQIHNEVNLPRGMEKEVIDLSDKLKMIKNVLDDAEKRGVKDASVKNWLKKLEDTAYEMDDILDEWSYSLVKHNKEYEQSTNASIPSKHKVHCSFIPTWCLCFKNVAVRHDTAMKIQNVKVKLDQISKEKNDFKFEISVPAIDHLPKSWRFQSISSIEFKKVYGMGINRNKNDLVLRLMLNDDSQIVSIVGKRGLGKTTLAQLVYNDPRVVKNDCFELRIWIYVSDPFDVGEIARRIVQRVTTEIIPPNTYQLELVMKKLRDSISGKKFLLVLDDVWTANYEEWKLLKINLKDGAAGSKILVTTRKERVATMMGSLDHNICRPELLSDEECWSLLRRISLPGRSEEECGEFEEVGKKIARKCNGLPLAANVLGSHLQFKHTLEEWEKALESEIWQLEEEDVEIFRHLVLSYNDLSSTLKRCFSYLAIYPKDYGIRAVNVIEEWMALGYLGSDLGNGREYFNKLAMRSFLQDFGPLEIDGQIELCKMHGIVHDFVQFLRKNNAAEMKKGYCQVCDPCLVSEAQEYRSLFWDNKTPLVICDCLASLRVLRFIRRENAPPQRLEKLIHLRLLDLSYSKLSKEDLKIICRLYLLQTLLLVGCTVEEIPEELGNLDGLRKLDLSENALMKLPESICSLLELQTLSLACCSLKEIGEEIGNMVGLRKLDLSRNALAMLPKSICSLLELETLFLADCSLKEIREEIGNMVGLRNLDLSMNEELKELPDSICGLLELQILDLRDCSNLNRLPERIHMLKKLQQLLMTDNPVRNRMPKGVGIRLKLEVFQVGRNKLGLLKNLNSLAGSLRLNIHLNRVSDLEELAEDARKAELRNKIHLQSLSIGFKGEMDFSSSLWMNVIEALEPNPKLEGLSIIGYGGCRFPSWISSSLNLVKHITLSTFSELSSLSHMGKLPLLESLYMEDLLELEVVGREFLGIESSSTQDVVAFPKLKELRFIKLNKWKEWEDITVEEEESAAVSVMPCLTHLTIKYSNSLKKLPHHLLRKASSLQILNIGYSPELIQRYRDKDGSPWRSISEYNPQLKLHRYS